MRTDWYHAFIPLIYSGFGYSIVRYLLYGVFRRTIGRAIRLTLTALVLIIALYLFVKYWQIPLPMDIPGMN